MKNRKLALWSLVAVTSLVGASCKTRSFNRAQSVKDVDSANRTPLGTFNITCKSGKTLLNVSSNQLYNGDPCGTERATNIFVSEVYSSPGMMASKDVDATVAAAIDSLTEAKLKCYLAGFKNCLTVGSKVVDSYRTPWSLFSDKDDSWYQPTYDEDRLHATVRTMVVGQNHAPNHMLVYNSEALPGQYYRDENFLDKSGVNLILNDLTGITKPAVMCYSKEAQASVVLAAREACFKRGGKKCEVKDVFSQGQEWVSWGIDCQAKYYAIVEDSNLPEPTRIKTQVSGDLEVECSNNKKVTLPADQADDLLRRGDACGDGSSAKNVFTNWAQHTVSEQSGIAGDFAFEASKLVAEGTAQLRCLRAGFRTCQVKVGASYRSTDEMAWHGAVVVGSNHSSDKNRVVIGGAAGRQTYTFSVNDKELCRYSDAKAKAEEAVKALCQKLTSSGKVNNCAKNLGSFPVSISYSRQGEQTSCVVSTVSLAEGMKN